MAKEDLDLDVEEAVTEKKSGGMKMIIIGVVGVIALVGSILGALYFAGVLGGDEAGVTATDAAAGADSKDGAAAKSGSATAAVPKGPAIYLPMEPAFVVNFGPKADVRFMQISIQIASRDAAVIELVKTHTPAIRNGLVMLYSSQDPIRLNTRPGKEDLLKQSLDEINRVLKEQTGSAGVENVYFTSFVMQ